jgi:hypothetical protein
MTTTTTERTTAMTIFPDLTEQQVQRYMERDEPTVARDVLLWIDVAMDAPEPQLDPEDVERFAKFLLQHYDEVHVSPPSPAAGLVKLTAWSDDVYRCTVVLKRDGSLYGAWDPDHLLDHEDCPL